MGGQAGVVDQSDPVEDRNEIARRVIRTAFNPAFARAMRGVAKAAGAPAPGVGWELREGPIFDNQVATLTVDGRKGSIKLDKTVPGEGDERRLECVFDRRL